MIFNDFLLVKKFYCAAKVVVDGLSYFITEYVVGSSCPVVTVSRHSCRLVGLLHIGYQDPGNVRWSFRAYAKPNLTIISIKQHCFQLLKLCSKCQPKSRTETAPHCVKSELDKTGLYSDEKDDPLSPLSSLGFG